MQTAMWYDYIWYSFIFHNNQFTWQVNQPSHFLTRVSLQELFALPLSQGGCTIHKTLGSFYLFNYWTHSLRKKRATGPWGMRGAVSSFVGDNKRQSVNRADGWGGRKAKVWETREFFSLPLCRLCHKLDFLCNSFKSFLYSSLKPMQCGPPGMKYKENKMDSYLNLDLSFIFYKNTTI